MTTAVQHRRGTTAEHSTFTGLEGEVTIDTTKDTAVIHDGSLAGGYPLAKETLANVNPSTLSAITGAATASDDLFLMYDTSALSMKKISRAELNNAITIEALDTVDINGGTIDGTAIGGTTPAAGAFTTLSATSLTNTGNTTLGDASTDTVTVNGYMGVGGAGTPNVALRVQNASLTGGTAQIQAYLNATADSDATGSFEGLRVINKTTAATYTTGLVTGATFYDLNKGAGNTVTNLHGIRINDQTQGTNNYGITSLVSSGTNKWNIYASGTAANYFAGALRVAATGTPTGASGTKITISANGGSDSAIGFINTQASGKEWLIGPGVGSGLATDFGLYNNSDGQLVMRIAGGAGGYTKLYAVGIERVSAGATEAVFNDPGNDYDFRVESDTNTHALFVQGSSGNVGIGTSSPRTKLDVYAGEAIISNGTAGTPSTGGTLWLNTGTSGTSRSAAIKAISASTSNDHSLLFYTNAPASSPVERARIDSSGHLIVPNGVTLGTAVGTYNAANTLDDYEEGTWTPVVRGNTTNGTYTYSDGFAKYTKIGNQVTIAFALTNITEVSAGTGYIQIAGLPFAKSGSAYFCGSVRYQSLTLGVLATSAVIEFIGSGITDVLYLRGIASGYGGIDVNISGITSGATDISATVTYTV